MSKNIITIKEYVEIKKQELKENLKNKEKSLAIVHVGNDYASERYIKGKIKDCEEVGIIANVYRYDETITETNLIEKIKELKEDGIIVQLPLPKHINVENIINIIPKEKDVDGFKYNSKFISCTPKGIVDYLKYNNIELEGKNICIIGRSNIVGKPLFNLLLEENATITLCHSKTKNIKLYCKNSDIIISAVGKPKFINKKYINENKTNYIMIDVGINRDENNKLCGDLDYEDLKDNCDLITPVPNGVGLLTRLALIENVCNT